MMKELSPLNKSEQRIINDIMELLVTHFAGVLADGLLETQMSSLHHAIDLARAAHEGQVRKSGEPFFIHPLRVAHLAARQWMDFPSVIAALLHDVVEDTHITIEEIEGHFGAEVALLVRGLTKVDDDNLSKEELKAKTYRKQVLLAMEDVRVLCLKFLDRIDNLETIGALRPEKQKVIAMETRDIYIPLAQHLGLRFVAGQLDALSLRVLYPRREKRYQSTIRKLQKETEAYLRQVRGRINETAKAQRLNYRLSDRWRTFSLAAAKDMKRGFPSLYTLEIQVDKISEAYQMLGVLHGLFPPIPLKLRDHIHAPSQFGYQAIKTTVQAGEKRMRVEITTRKLARFNQAGVLAPGFTFSTEKFHNLMHSLMDGENVFDIESLRLAHSSIRVYTPRGEARDLPEGSSALDFAFDIHESLGLQATRARINGKIRQLKTRLIDGDQVEIDQHREPQALPRWLEWVATPRARNAIRRYLRNRVKKSEESERNSV